MPTMSPDARAELVAKRAEFARKLTKREAEPGFEANCADLRQWIADIDGDLAADDAAQAEAQGNA